MIASRSNSLIAYIKILITNHHTKLLHDKIVMYPKNYYYLSLNYLSMDKGTLTYEYAVTVTD